jgi:hypothetical protein
MRPGRPTPLTLTRRALGTRLAGFAAAIGFGQSAATSVSAQPASTVDLELRDAALRGLALASHRGDPVAAAAAEAALARLAETDPEAALLGRIYQLLDVRPAAYWHGDLACGRGSRSFRAPRGDPCQPAGGLRIHRPFRTRDNAYGPAPGLGASAPGGEAAGVVRGAQGLSPVLRARHAGADA